MCICVPCYCLSVAFRGHKRAPYPLELKLETVISYIWVLGTQPGSFVRAINAPNRLAISVAPCFCFFVHMPFYWMTPPA